MLFDRLFTSLLVSLCLILAACSDSSGNAAPDVTFNTLDGQTISTQELRGKVVLVKFWATDCTTCVAQMPATIDRYQALSSQGFETVAIAMKHDPESYVRNFTRSRQLPFPVVMDRDGSLAKAFGDVKMTPTTLLIDKKGRIIKRYLGNYDETKLVSTINKALTG
ncbi:MAG TPA: TlpA disulfide reductase family protein [Burkholderiaceae bacterium]|nr:TlpA disulfide reductase family protein [Burkholderiaceae bacterium]